ncbi:hypothetical protein M409DRAFT_22131 [Zasmidium cellare ATCC 36951]|uniref:FAD-binding domain-containing protein n=1 Tax=Zasmidium cellare ATCC 36951 TaxID=1080233 RepID=A0A6A6CL56_ZASCE|nr:uncharacterized protein M409DRAFT_22131 [Zasmidium cellare ATCC 36951]KAF2167987.1 hypothetical protein M409DRAFT_22131 [Zasmidium cellare ATCC 36951]
MRPILIIGAGTSGLTLAQGLRLHSIPFRIFEKRPNALTAQGHRFRLSRETLQAIRCVLSPELQVLFDRTAAQSNAFKPRYVDAQEFRFELPVRVEGVDSQPVDRSWLRALLMVGIEGDVEYGKEFESSQVLEDGDVEVQFTDGTSTRGPMLVGADGVHSKVRGQLQPQRQLLDLERWIIWGRTPLTRDLREGLSADTLSWYMVQDEAANMQVVVEPMIWTSEAREASRGRLPHFEDYIYWCVCIPSGEESIPQSAADRMALLERVTETWHPEINLVLRSAPAELSSCIPVLSSAPDIGLSESEDTGRVTIVGDAAHVMSPMGGSGASTAVQNAADLAATIATSGSLRDFEARMAERARERIEHSFQGGKKFWKGKEWHEYRAATTAGD